MASTLITAALKLIIGLEQVSGMPIAVLERTGDDPASFWARTAQILCDKTEENWCEEDVQFMTANTNPLGFSRVITYVGKGGVEKKVCAILPALETVSSSFAATGISGGAVFTAEQLPESDYMQAWILLNNAARCLDQSGGAEDQQRADAFPSIGLMIMSGDTAFASPYTIGPSRYFQRYRNANVNRWATNVGERVLFDHFKTEAASEISQISGCSGQAIGSTRMDTDRIPRDSQLQQSDYCHQGQTGSPARVTDSNLHLWMSYVGAPPNAYEAFEIFNGSQREAASYIWSAAGQISSQY